MKGDLPCDPALRKLLEKSGGKLQGSDGTSCDVSTLFPDAERALQLKAAAPPRATEPAHYKDEKVIGLYFTASWCPPCMKFTPQLKRTYTAAIEDRHHDFEVVTCSWDQDRSQYDDYVGTMPWKRLPFRDPRIDELNHAYGVSSIPTLIIVRARDGKVINRNARDMVAVDNRCSYWPWPPVKAGWATTIGTFVTWGVLSGLAWITLRDKRFLRPKA